MGKIIFARHGECRDNVNNRIGGRSESPMTRKGIQQAHELANKMRALKITHILCSDLSRARGTAEICAHYLKTPVEVLPELTERSYGVLEGIHYNDLQKMATKFKTINGRVFVIDGPGVETIEKLYERAARVLREIKRRSDEVDGDLLVVSHAGLIRMFKAIHADIPIEQYFEIGFMDNAEVFVIE